MGIVIVLTPVVIGSWPIITAAVTAAAAGLGLTVSEEVLEALHQEQQNTEQQVEVELEESQVLAENVASGKELVLTKEGITLKVTRDARGQCKICASGKGYTQAELKQLAEQFSQKVAQCFVYNRTVTELKRHNFQTVNEDVTEDGTIRVHVRRWVD
jgi:hypothetical protein